METFDRRSYIVTRIKAKKNALNALLDQAQVSGLNDGLRFQIKRTRQDITDAKAVLTKLDARNARSLKNKPSKRRALCNPPAELLATSGEPWVNVWVKSVLIS